MAWINHLISITYNLELFHANTFSSPYIARYYEFPIIQQFYSFHLLLQDSTMDASQYWSFAREYSMWNAAVTALQLWMADHEPHILSYAIG